MSPGAHPTMVTDHGTIDPMDTMPISRFKATCLAALDQVRRTGRPLLVTKRGVPIAQVIPPPRATPPTGSFGSMARSGEQLGDILTPLPEGDWEVLR